MLPQTGSTMTAAICPGLASKSARIAASSFQPTVSVSAAVPAVTPAEPGMPSVAAPEPAALEPRFLPLDQSNSTILYGSQWLLKLLRKVEGGPNMELEVGHFLASARPSARVPRPPTGDRHFRRLLFSTQ